MFLYRATIVAVSVVFGVLHINPTCGPVHLFSLILCDYYVMWHFDSYSMMQSKYTQYKYSGLHGAQSFDLNLI